MFPYLSDFINYFFGTQFVFPIPMFGTMVALSFIAGNKILEIDMRRKQKEGLFDTWYYTHTIGKKFGIKDFLSQFPLGFFFGYKFVGAFLKYDLFVASPQQFIFSLEGSFIGGLVLGLALTFLRYNRMNKEKLAQPKEEKRKTSVSKVTTDITFLAMVFGIIGAKLFDLIENLPSFIESPIETLISGTGLSIYGGIILSGIAIITYCRVKKLPAIFLLDSLAITIALSYAIGRVGCQLSGDGDWGIPNDLPMPTFLSILPEWMWSFDYPNNVLGVNLKEDFSRMGLQSLTGRAWPTPFYETIMSGVTFIVFWIFRKKIKIPGIIISIYFIANGLQRYFIENLRINRKYSAFGIEMTQAQYVALAFIVLGIIGIFYFLNKKKNNELTTKEDS